MAKGENIFKRKDGRWEARYIKGYELSGKIKYGFCYGKTYREAKEKVTKCKAALVNGKPIPSTNSRHRFAFYCDEWPTVYGKENLQPGDLIFYKSEGANTKVTHVAIWLGGNKLIHASASEGCVCITSWGGWSDRNFLFGKRVF